MNVQPFDFNYEQSKMSDISLFMKEKTRVETKEKQKSRSKRTNNNNSPKKSRKRAKTSPKIDQQLQLSEIPHIEIQTDPETVSESEELDEGAMIIQKMVSVQCQTDLNQEKTKIDELMKLNTSVMEKCRTSLAQYEVVKKENEKLEDELQQLKAEFAQRERDLQVNDENYQI